MDEGLLAELRAIGATTADAPGVLERDQVAARIDALAADPDNPDLRREFVRWADRTASRAPTAEMRSAARTLLTLLRDGTPPAVLHTVDPPISFHVNPRTAVVFAIVAACAVAGGLVAARIVTTPPVRVSGPPHDAPVGPATDGKLVFTATGSPSLLRREQWTLDGHDVTALVRHHAGAAVFKPGRLDEGAHQLSVTARGGFLGSVGRKTFNFTVDLTPPTLNVSTSFHTNAWQPLRVAGQTEDDARVTVAGRVAAVDDGSFSIELPAPQPRVITIAATDPAGNRTVEQQPLAVTPRKPPAAVRAVHVTADAWADPTLRNGVLALIRSHRINAVEIDLKDEGGIAGWDPPVALARKIGAAQPIYNLRAVVERLHSMGVWVIGRIVCFRDPILATAAWNAGKRNEVVQTPSGGEYSGYGGFTNFANPVVRAYNIAIAVAAAKDGIDDILYDYVRRPDGPISSMRFPDIHGTPTAAIVDFLRETHIALEPYHTFLGASVFGIAALRPDETAQNVSEMARWVDYIAPLDYPSHWAPGAYGLADPNAQPYQIIVRSLADFQEEVVGTPARIVPWLQDFSLGYPAYGPYQVAQEIAGARKDGIDEYVLWDPDVTYTAGALTRNAPPERTH